ncbi:amidase [Gordonia sp. X0973]|uniref:amidase n=1 Tax=Gordonia sp. X0973 TaxID=2742602 RepID=UPI000F526E47|nr:amidase [Gordonia sp. X0973]QKT07509.1 amidase [Gordonia sp. X0973]
MNLDEYMGHDATALAELVAAKQVTPKELLDLARKRAGQVNGKLNAIVINIDREADEQVKGDLTGPFAGVPFLVKDLHQEYKGYPTTAGCRALRNDVATENALLVDRFLDAGLVIFGKTATPELGSKGITESKLWGPCRNPWDTSRTPGGSSGGSAASVAAGIVPAAGANDGGGSIRIPAACNGLVGLKPSRGLAPYGPQRGESMFGMATEGVVARTVRDTAGLMDVIVGRTPFADYQAAMPSRKFAEAIKKKPRKLKIGFSAHSAITGKADPQAVAAMTATAELLTDLGHVVEEVAPPYDDKALAQTFLTIWFAQLEGQVAEIKARTGAKDSDFEPDTLAVAEIGRASGVAALMAALGQVKEYTYAMERFYADHDFFLTPTIACEPIKVGSLDTPVPLQVAARVVHRVHAGKALVRTGVIDQMIDDNLGWVPYTQLANLTGRPAITVPVHWTADGLPLGVQFNGALGADAALLQLATQLEEAQPWIERFPAEPKHHLSAV